MLDALDAWQAGDKDTAAQLVTESKGLQDQARALRVDPPRNSWGKVQPRSVTACSTPSWSRRRAACARQVASCRCAGPPHRGPAPGTDTAVGRIGDAGGKQDKYRVQIFVNGWNTGQFVNNVVPQEEFVIPSGFLKPNGDNSVALAVTAEQSGVGPDSGQGVVEIDHRVQVEVWIRWDTADPSAEDYVRAGYDIINAPCDHLYFILAPGQQHGTGKKSAQGIYDLWAPRTFMSSPGQDIRLAEGAPMSGGHLSVWCDNPDFQTEQQVSDSVRPRLRSFAQQMWGR
ncbi:beta galactosidase jelly roll domain-containing protein [Streptomyces sp. M10(2022)]